MMDAILQDLRLAVRTLITNPGFSAVAILTLALGIGANTAIFSVLYGVLLRPLPYREPDRIVALAQTYAGGRGARSLTYLQFRFFERRSEPFESYAASTSVGFNLSTETESHRVYGLRVSRDYFRVLGVAPRLGRTFTADEDQPGGPSAIILSDGLWQRRFGGDPGVVGRGILVDGRPATVVGVMPPGFTSPSGAEAWSTLAQVGRTVGGGSNLSFLARLRPGQTLEQARAGVAVVDAAFHREFAGTVSRDITLDLDPYRRQVAGDLRAPVRLLFGAIGLVLLIACANVANLLLGRVTTRSRELAVRVALGATRGRLMRQLLTESLVLALLGGGAGLVFASWGLSALLALEPGALPSISDIRVDGWALGFTFGLSVLTGLLFGLLPAWHAVRTDLHGTLKEATGHATAGAGHGHLRHILVVAEIALSLVLLVGAGLLIQTFARLIRTDPGFDPERVVAAEIWLTGSRYDSTPAIAGFYRSLTTRLEGLPGVASAAVVEAGLPLERGGNTPVVVEGREERLSVDFRAVTPGYFQTLGVPLTAGRGFAATDGEGAPPVVIVNEAFARRYLADGDPLGRTLTLLSKEAPRQVVGVVRDVKSFVGSATPPTVFIPSAQTPAGFTRLFGSWFPIHVVVRATGDPRAVTAMLPQVIRAADPLVPVGQVRTLDEVLWSSLAFQRFVMWLLTAFAGLAIVLAAVGLYGVISYLVTQRTHEIGVRMALGAESRDVLRMVLRQGLALTGIGVVLGLVAALAVTHFLTSLLYDVRPTDAPTLLGVTAVLVLVALMATWLPARRATRVDPMIALRSE